MPGASSWAVMLRRCVLGLTALVPVLVLVVFLPVSSASFTASTQTPGNSFTSAASFRLTLLAGTAGCVSATGTGGLCTTATSARYPTGVVGSVDGKNVYTTHQSTTNSVNTFSRNAATGALTQLAGTAGCTSETGTSGACVDGKALTAASDVAVSPDDKNVYVAAAASDAVAVFSRNLGTGALTQLAGTAGCVSETGSSGACVDGKGLDGAYAVAVSPDGGSVYAISQVTNGVAVFSRNPSTGALTQLAGTAGCVSETGSAGACIDGKALSLPFGLAVSPDSTSVYVASQTSSAVSVFSRNVGTGALTQLAGTAGCVSDTGSSGACVDGSLLSGARDAAVSPDGASVYVSAAGSNAVTAFSRNPTTGALTQLTGVGACVSETADGGLCVDGRALNQVMALAVSPDGENIYGASYVSDAVPVLRRDPLTGRLGQDGGTAGCVSDTGTSGTCVDGNAMDSVTAVAVSVDGKDVYCIVETSETIGVFYRQR